MTEERVRCKFCSYEWTRTKKYPSAKKGFCFQCNEINEVDVIKVDDKAQTTLTGHQEGYEGMEASTIKDLKRTKEKVKYILETYPQSRGSDTLLIWKFLRTFYPYVRISFHQFQDLLTLPAFETLTRCRRVIQNKDGLFKPTERVCRKRKRREEIISEGIKDV